MHVLSENRAAEQVAQALDTILSGLPNDACAVASEVRIVIGSIAYMKSVLNEVGQVDRLVFATRLGGLSVVAQCAYANRLDLPQLMARIAARSTQAPAPRQAARAIQTQQRFVADVLEGRFSLAAQIYRVLSAGAATVLSMARFSVSWADRRSCTAGEQLVNEHLLGGSELDFESAALPPIPDRDASPSRHHDLEVPGAMVLSKFAAFPVALFSVPRIDYDLPVPSSTAVLNLRGWPEITTLGRADNHDRAKMVAAIEAIERYAGLLAKPAREVFESSFRDIEGVAVDPRDLGVHPDSSYATPAFPYRRIDSDTVVDWIWADNLVNGARTAVPASAGFYGGSPDFPRVRLLFETSSGCAIGCSQNEAILHGIMELAERDAFLLSWYRKECLGDITAAVCIDDRVRWAVQRITLTTGCEIRVLRSTKEYSIPSVIVVAIAKSIEGPCLALAAGGSLTYADATMAALNELSGHVFFLRQMYRRPKMIERAHALFEDGASVASMEDHGIVNALPAGVERCSFLWAGSRIDREFLESEEVRSSRSVEESLDLLLQRLGRCGFDVFAVTQSSNLLNSAALFCEKVVIPGFVPMTFGHGNRRVRLPRIGNKDQQLAAEAMPPHPFM